jgi:hypothetical protein
MTEPNDTKIDNADLETDNPVQAEQPRKKRGPYNKTGAERKPANASAQKGKKEKLSARQLTGIIYLGNSAAASALKQPDLEIQEAEAALIADAVVDVLQHYDFEASAKTLAWGNLVGVLATVYGVKIWSILQKPKITNHESNVAFVDFEKAASR